MLIAMDNLLHMFHPSWHISPSDRKHYVLLFEDLMDRIQAKTLQTFLNDYIISSFIHNRILHRAHLFGNTFIWYFLIGYICNLVNTLSELLFFGIDELQNTLKNTECKISILILPWFLSKNTALSWELLTNDKKVQYRLWNLQTKFKLSKD